LSTYTQRRRLARNLIAEALVNETVALGNVWSERGTEFSSSELPAINIVSVTINQSDNQQDRRRLTFLVSGVISSDVVHQKVNVDGDCLDELTEKLEDFSQQIECVLTNLNFDFCSDSFIASSDVFFDHSGGRRTAVARFFINVYYQEEQ
jgi:hypothetical protein